MKHRAFSLIEVAVASSIAAIISTAAISTFAMINKQVVRMQGGSVASDHAKSIIDLLVSDMQGIGGGAIRPWMAVHVEDGGGLRDVARDTNFNMPSGPVLPDRITFATAIPGAPTCVITAMAGDNDLTSTGTGASCCLRALFNAREAGTSALQAFLVKGASYRQVAMTAPVDATCTAKFTQGQLYLNDQPQAAWDYVGAELVAASVRTIYLTADRELRLYRETESTNGVPENGADENIRLAGNVVDFQVQLGYDVDGDGRILDTSSNNDEWRYNTVGPTSHGVPGLRTDALRMIGVGVIVAQPVNDPTYVSRAEIVGSTSIKGERQQLRAAMGKVALRNLFVFF